MRKLYGICVASVTLFALARLVIAQTVEQQVEKVTVLSAVDPEAYKEFMSAQVSDVYDLEQFFTDQQNVYLPITPPVSDFVLRQPGCPYVLPFSWKTFPPEFSKNLVLDYENGVPVYSLTIVEDTITRETVFLNAKGEKLFALPPAPGYDPFAYLRSIFPSLYAGRYSSDQVSCRQSLYDPARIQILAKLIPTEYVEPYLYVADRIQEEQAALSTASLGGGFTLLRSEEAESNIVFETITRTTNGIRMTIGYPDEFTNRLDVFTCNNLMDYVWSIAVRYLSTTGTNEIPWTDTNSWVVSGLPARFYCAANADLDSDSDGYSDPRENLVYKTDPNDSNSRPVRVSGTVSYSGLETGAIFVVSVMASDSWSIAKSVALPGPGAYTNDEIGNNQSYWFKAFRDVNTNSARDAVEPWGIYSASSTLITNDRTGVNITMQDVPSISGTIDYTGTQTGDIHIVAIAASNSWSTTYECVIPWVQGSGSMSGDVTYVDFPAGYTILGMPASNYWIRAFIDSDTNLAYTHLEAAGQYTSNAIPVSNRVMGINFTIGQDSDSDQMPDWWEWQYRFDPANSNDAGLDRDNDGAANWKEYLFNINPGNPDSDGDGIKDGWEIQYGLAPANSNDALQDLDGDGFNNLTEYQHGTYPNNPDSDGDLISDGPKDPPGPVIAGGDPNPMILAPNTLPYGLVPDINRSVQLGEDPVGRPIVAWLTNDQMGYNQVRVMKCFGSPDPATGKWVSLSGRWEGFGESGLLIGMTATTNTVGSFSFAADTNGNPVVAWSERRNGVNNIYLRHWTGTNWQGIGSSDTGFGVSGQTNGVASELSMALYSNGNPVVCWVQSAATYPYSCLCLKFWNGTNWVALGSSTNGSGLSGDYVDMNNPVLKVDRSGRPVVAWRDILEANHTRRWMGSSWTDLGSLGNRVYDLNIPDLAIGPANEPFVCWSQGQSLYPAYGFLVQRYSNGVWQGLGGSGSGVGLCSETNAYVVYPYGLWVQTNRQIGAVWCEYVSASNAYRLISKVWNPATTNWTVVGNSSAGYGIKPHGRVVRSVAMTAGRGSPVVAYADPPTDGASCTLPVRQLSNGGEQPVDYLPDSTSLVVRQFTTDSDHDGLRRRS